MSNWSEEIFTIKKVKIEVENCFLGSVKLTKNADIDKYGYS